MVSIFTLLSLALPVLVPLRVSAAAPSLVGTHGRATAAGKRAAARDLHPPKAAPRRAIRASLGSKGKAPQRDGKDWSRKAKALKQWRRERRRNKWLSMIGASRHGPLSAKGPKRKGKSPNGQAVHAPGDFQGTLIHLGGGSGVPAGEALVGVPESDYDVFFVFLGQHFNGHVAEWAAEMARGEGRVHILADHQDSLRSALDLAAQHQWGRRFVVGDVGSIAGRVKDDFMSRYMHESVNTVEYEAMCFWRWGVVHDYMQALEASGVNLCTIFTIDGDILPTKPFSQWMPKRLPLKLGAPVSLVRFINGAVMTWSRQELSGFWSFVTQLYSSPQKHEAFVREWADHVAGRLHVSDMQALIAFIAAAPARRVTAFTIDVLAVLPPSEWSDYSCAGLRAVQLLEGSHLALAHDQPASNPFNMSITTPKFNVPLPLCFLHFQGPSKRHIAPVAEFLRIHQTGSTYKF